jgi:hypothetical protein
MSVTSEGTFLRVSASGKEPVTLRVQGGETVTVRLEIESTCTCGSAAAPSIQPGSYTYVDPQN